MDDAPHEKAPPQRLRGAFGDGVILIILDRPHKTLVSRFHFFRIPRKIPPVCEYRGGKQLLWRSVPKCSPSPILLGGRSIPVLHCKRVRLGQAATANQDQEHIGQLAP